MQLIVSGRARLPTWLRLKKEVLAQKYKKPNVFMILREQIVSGRALAQRAKNTRFLMLLREQLIPGRTRLPTTHGIGTFEFAIAQKY